MGLGTITLLGMLCAPGQAPGDLTPWNSPSMKIPIEYNQNKRGEIKELHLYVSADQGQTWQQHAVATPDKDSTFTFNAPADGVYWFNMVVVEKSGKREPADVFKAAPALKVLFDTKKPVVQITGAQRAGDDVTVGWKVTEKNPDWTKFKLEYSTNGTTWAPVATRPEPDGSTQFKVAGAGPLTVRVALTDVAGHSGEATSPVAGTTVATKADGNVKVVGGMADLPAPPLVGEMTPALPPPGGPTTERSPKDIREPKGTDTAPSPAPGVAALPPAPGTLGGPRVLGTTDAGAIPPPPAAADSVVGVSTPAPASNLPVAQVINVTTFKLAYEVEDKGASGVGKAEVWVTRDDGRNWRRWTVVEKPESPLMVDLAKQEAKDVEGVYGLKVVLQSGAGLSREAPKAGEAPDLRVDVDTTPPTLAVYEPVPDKAQKDTLVLRWTAADRNLAADPITLEWAEGPKGPWLPIAAAEGGTAGSGAARRLANTGSYPWKLPANFPTHKVYLKVSARDTAGNVSEVIPKEPILVDLNKPAATGLKIVGGR